MGASLLLSPYGNSGDPTEIFDTVTASPGTATILGWLSLIVGLTLIPGVIATGWAALQGAPRLATAALLIAVPGWSAGLLFPSPELMASALDAAGVERATAVAVLTSLVEFNSPALAATVLIFVVAHIGGTVLLGLALYRARVVPYAVGHPARAGAAFALRRLRRPAEHSTRRHRILAHSPRLRRRRLDLDPPPPVRQCTLPERRSGG